MDTIDTFLDEVLNEVAKGARLDGFHAKDLLAYPNQSDRYMKPAKASIKQFIENRVKEVRVDEIRVTLRLLKIYKKGILKGDIIDDLETRIKALTESKGD